MGLHPPLLSCGASAAAHATFLRINNEVQIFFAAHPQLRFMDRNRRLIEPWKFKNMECKSFTFYVEAVEDDELRLRCQAHPIDTSIAPFIFLEDRVRRSDIPRDGTEIVELNPNISSKFNEVECHDFTFYVEAIEDDEFRVRCQAHPTDTNTEPFIFVDSKMSRSDIARIFGANIAKFDADIHEY